MNIEELNKRFGVFGTGDAVSFEAGPGGLAKAVLRSKQGEAHLMLHGAHLVHFQPAGEKPVLWMSGKSWFEDGKPIRGGVPICLPWFGAAAHDPAAPSHGLVRLREWAFASARLLPDGRVEATLEMQSDDWTKSRWPGDYRAKFTVTVGRTLTMSLTVTNTGTRPVVITEALHTYFAVSDIRGVKVHGLEKLPYIDTAGGGRRPMRQDNLPITFVAETDRQYTGTAATTVIEDEGMGRRITVEKSGSNSTVVWNPWTAKAERMPDFGNDEWPGMLCVETANVGDDAITLAPAASHTMVARIS